MAKNSALGMATLAAAAGGAAMAFVGPSAGPQQTSGALRATASAAGAAPRSAPAQMSSSAACGSLGVVAAAAAVLGSKVHAAGRQEKRNVVACNAFESELGVQPPLGYWDPLGLSADGDVAAFKRRRTVELKHGRISMLAAMGYITPEIAGKFPGYCSPSMGLKFADIPNGLSAISKVPALGWAQMIAYGAAVELSSTGGQWLSGPDYANVKPGDYGFKAITSDDPAELKKKLSAELANGRLAMMAIIGMFYQDGLTGSAWGDWANYTESPLRAFENELGVQAPVGFWDPAGYCKDGNAELFRRRRETELKHGRVSMIACIGYIVPEFFKWPGYCSPSQAVSFDSIPNGLGALTKVPAGGWIQMVLFAGLADTGYFRQEEGRAPGDFANGGVLGVPNASGPMKDSEARTKKLNAELANGRLAMMAIIGMFFQDGLTGSAWGDWALYTASPLRAFENELGVQAPVGFWDPAGYCKDGDAALFRRRRETELKHGRISMIACIGYIVPEYFKWPGYLSPSQSVSFDSVPNGLAAVSKIPAAGLIQMVLFGGLIDTGYFQQDPSRAPGDFVNGGVLGVPNGSGPLKDSEARTKKLSAELANGRLAMMAIIGMFFQDGLTGSAWGDWALYTASPLRAFENELGVQPPVGFWDPAGYCKEGNAEDFRRRRETELKHGRVSMIACIGYIVPEYFKWPGYLSPSEAVSFDAVPNGLGAVSKIPAAGLIQMVLFAGLVDTGYFRQEADRAPGDFANGGVLGVPNGSGPLKDAEERKKKLSAELANGRLAMMAIIGMFFQDGLTGSAWGDWALYTASPLRAFESELGVQAPLGFWDPAGLCNDGDAVAFRRRRETEIKHGRVAMWATLGYIVPEYFRWPGYCSPSEGVKFTDIPAGLAAVSKVPGAGWCQMFLFAGVLEKGVFVYDESRAPGDFERGGVLGVPNGSTLPAGETKTRKLNAEIANGRLAMMAIIGMFYQDGLTGSAWGDWSLYTDSPLR